MKPIKLIASVLPVVLLTALGTPNARAIPTNGIFGADNSFFSYSFSNASTMTFSANTTSYAGGGFAPVLTLFNTVSGAEIDNMGTGTSDVSLMDTLGAGSYILYLTEFPNVAVGNLSDGFLFAVSPNATGDICGVTGGKFLDTTKTPCVQRTSAFAVNTTLAAATPNVPEPTPLLLVLPPTLLLLGFSRRLS